MQPCPWGLGGWCDFLWGWWDLWGLWDTSMLLVEAWQQRGPCQVDRQCMSGCCAVKGCPLLQVQAQLCAIVGRAQRTAPWPCPAAPRGAPAAP